MGSDTGRTERLGLRSFDATHWSVVLTAGRSDTQRGREALETLCRAYWQPLYAYVRRAGQSPADAEDLTQAFFVHLLEHKWLARADQSKGRFRSFLLTALKRFLADEWDHRRARKRGGGIQFVSLDDHDTRERQIQAVLIDGGTPEQAFEQQWARTVLQTVLDSLGEEYRKAGKAELFAALKVALTQGRAAVDYSGLAQRLQMSEGGLRVAVHRLRRRYREILRWEVARTVSKAEDIDAELRYLFQVLTG